MADDREADPQLAAPSWTGQVASRPCTGPGGCSLHLITDDRLDPSKLEPVQLSPVAPPFPVTSPYRVVPAPRPLDGPHVLLDDAWPASVRRRVERLAGDLDGVVVRDSQSPDDAGLAAALRAAWHVLPLPVMGDLVAVPLLGVEVDLGTATATRTGPTADESATALVLGCSGLDLLVVGWLLACSDDLVVLRRSGPGTLRAELLAVAFPSGWSPRQRAGASLLDLHAPVADGERLQRAAPALSEALLTKGPYEQHVWGLDPSGRLDRDPSAPDAERPARPEPSGWWLRVERQTTLPLPGLDRALFTIRPYLVPLTALDPYQRRTLHDALASMSPDGLTYKGILDVSADLLAWLAGPS